MAASAGSKQQQQEAQLVAYTQLCVQSVAADAALYELQPRYRCVKVSSHGTASTHKHPCNNTSTRSTLYPFCRMRPPLLSHIPASAMKLYCITPHIITHKHTHLSCRQRRRQRVLPLPTPADAPSGAPLLLLPLLPHSQGHSPNCPCCRARHSAQPYTAGSCCPNYPPSAPHRRTAYPAAGADDADVDRPWG
jgi:hypothetical protein